MYSISFICILYYYNLSTYIIIILLYEYYIDIVWILYRYYMIIIMNTCVYISCVIKATPASSIRVDDNCAQVASDSANYERPMCRSKWRQVARHERHFFMSGRKIMAVIYFGPFHPVRVKIVSTVSSHYRLIPVEVQCRDCPGCDHGWWRGCTRVTSP